MNTKMLLGAGGLAVAILFSTAPVQAQTANKPVTEEQFKRYYDLFNKKDPAWSDILADELVFPHPSGKTFRSRDEVVEFYKKQPERVHDDRIPTNIVIDNERGRAAVEMQNRFWTDEGKTYTFENGDVIRGGELWAAHVVIFYDLKDGKIVGIHGAKSGPGPIKRIN